MLENQLEVIGKDALLTCITHASERPDRSHFLILFMGRSMAKAGRPCPSAASVAPRGRTMLPSDQSTTETPGQDAWFKTTHWSAVLEARQRDSAEGHAALSKLCQTYWRPLYVFIRRQGHKPEDAQDLVQGFFAQVLSKHYFSAADPEKGKFRSFLLVALKRFMANEHDRANRQKRGGGQELISLDALETESRYLSEPRDDLTPEREFERQWATELLKQALSRLKAEWGAAGKQQLFAELEVFLSGDAESGSYSEAGQRLGLSAEALRSSVYRLRRRFRELLRLEIANTVDTPEAIDEELRNLFAALS